jgi:hypothetical protein
VLEDVAGGKAGAWLAGEAAEALKRMRQNGIREESNRPIDIWREARTLTGYDSAVWSVEAKDSLKRLGAERGK